MVGAGVQADEVNSTGECIRWGRYGLHGQVQPMGGRTVCRRRRVASRRCGPISCRSCICTATKKLEDLHRPTSDLKAALTSVYSSPASPIFWNNRRSPLNLAAAISLFDRPTALSLELRRSKTIYEFILLTRARTVAIPRNIPKPNRTSTFMGTGPQTRIAMLDRLQSGYPAKQRMGQTAAGIAAITASSALRDL